WRCEPRRLCAPARLLTGATSAAEVSPDSSMSSKASVSMDSSEPTSTSCASDSVSTMPMSSDTEGTSTVGIAASGSESCGETVYCSSVVSKMISCWSEVGATLDPEADADEPDVSALAEPEETLLLAPLLA